MLCQKLTRSRSTYQYICPNSAHPPWMLKGIDFSMLKRYYYQNSHLEDFWEIAMLLYKRLKDQGWDRKTLKQFFVLSHDKILSPRKKIQEQVEPISNRELATVDSEYNRYNIQRKKMREMWNETMELLEKDTNKAGLGIKQVIFAYSRARNLKDLLQRANLHKNKDHKASTFLGVGSSRLSYTGPFFVTSETQNTRYYENFQLTCQQVLPYKLTCQEVS